MYVYVGKLNYLRFAENECITIVFPAGFALKDPVCAYWQWTVDSKGVAKSNCTQEGFITSVTNTTVQYYIRCPLSWYTFEGSVSSDFSSLSLKMSELIGTPQDVSLSLVYSDAVRVPSTSVFTGKLNWFEFSKNEMVTLVIPGEVANGAPVILSYQWTKDGVGKPKVNHTVIGTLSNVFHPRSLDGGSRANATFGDGYYDFTFRQAGTGSVVLSMTNPSGESDATAPNSVLNRTDFRESRKKKALILRFGTGTDQGIFLVQDMLFKHLGFASEDIELSYFDIDPEDPKEPKHCTLGQDPPTAANFRSKFTQLCQSADAGDVRFLYVDAHGTTYPDEDNSGEPDGQDEGWVLAENNDGTRKEVVSDDWLGTCIRNHVAKGVNLTILTSSCMGGGMLDTHSATPGILLAGCHETQFNVKALAGRDPWMLAVTTVIKKNIQRKRGVPTYSVLFNDAKNFIRALLAEGPAFSPRYKGPSPKEWEPIPMDMDSNPTTSHQDPQLVFYDGYFDPEQERFLFPFEAPSGGRASGDSTRFPRDEYPRHDEF
ncbi:hypothetical protein B0H16DRAFT_1673425 [Mycena metata]|uniref:Uncharacterized protein n=1 Tax=Mycena metata TaxID=1033252 RepID=A0AAD7JS36_9AGAR|nr:hypothetical protein B0H16DRAFT_1673425 [Mycena metata]